ncbi:DoxX family protein [Bosea psychrotolerans]|uniref:Putative membrane protein YphA (DoxX/SURF4 family) n=1 Tax=Bosea psychrotolerans TaxID=1871628 RepID=A0A2S4MCE0_9HYPH|nr:DoxX family protein [Bosea psychrotolerans]POR52418.1 putative membrane protein YphA (DoxX/SURF4 family) [Bosea psychrotolerans]
MSASPLPAVQPAVETLLGRSWLALLARIAVALPFLLSGLAKLADFGGATIEVRGLTGLEPAALFAVLVIATQLGGSALLIAGGRHAWIGAVALAGFTAIATLFAHAFWVKPAAERVLHQNIFFEHVSIIGGLALLAILAARSSGKARP